MIIKCSNCGARYRVGDDLVANGPKRFKCKSCGTVLLVRPPETAKAPVQEKTPPGNQQPPQKQQQHSATPGPSAASVEESADAEKPLHNDTEQQETSSVKTDRADESIQASGEQADGSELTAEEIAAQQQQNLQKKLEERRRQMEDEISGRLNKAALETLDFDVLSELAHQLQDIQQNPDFTIENDSKLFSCIRCKTTFCLYPEDSRLCTNCPDEVSLIRADDILKQFGMFG